VLLEPAPLHDERGVVRGETQVEERAELAADADADEHETRLRERPCVTAKITGNASRNNDMGLWFRIQMQQEGGV